MDLIYTTSSRDPERRGVIILNIQSVNQNTFCGVL